MREPTTIEVDPVRELLKGCAIVGVHPKDLRAALAEIGVYPLPDWLEAEMVGAYARR